jgi:hypothetical protein
MCYIVGAGALLQALALCQCLCVFSLVAVAQVFVFGTALDSVRCSGGAG